MPVIVGVISFKKLQKEGILILLLVITGSIPQLARGILGRKDFIYIFYNANILIELTILYLFFKIYLDNGVRYKALLISYVISILFGVFLIIHYSFVHRFFNEWVCLNNLLFTGWILMLLLEIYESDEVVLNPAIPLFWFVIGLFLYCCCTVLIFSLWNYIMAKENTVLNNLWIVHDVFNTSMYIIFSFGFSLYNRKYNY